MAAQASAQNFLSWQYNDRYFTLALGTGQTTYFGELNSNNRLNEDLTHISLGMEARLWSKVGARAELIYYNIANDDRFADDSTFAQQRNLSFESKNLEFSLQGIFYLHKYSGNYHKRRNMDPYLALGVGFTTFNPKASLDGTTYKLRQLETEGTSYSNMALVFPGAIGVKFRMNDFMNFNMEIAYRYTMTDYLDDVSDKFVTHDDLTVSLLANRRDEIDIVNQEAYDQMIPGGKRGNPDTKDSYLLLRFQLEIFLPPGGGATLKKTPTPK